ncbi:SNF2 family N-terminal domain-containing protein [Apiosordaria backusii]|uniref:SNF2 family N-terminal domain-containing protein n=1 Tax=Apiosordaria backusii TaxID=314023 RepID=A0AA40BNK6_9PEZI|nr:SNF2 family N-terminal domain-containing protein [Apiosordaria backusii]
MDLEDEIAFQSTILKSLAEQPRTPEINKQIRDAKAELIKLKERARGTLSQGQASSNLANGLSSRMSNPPSSSPGRPTPHHSASGSRKRSFGSAHLNVNTSIWGPNNSNRASPSPGFGDSSFEGFGSNDVDDDPEIIDLTEQALPCQTPRLCANFPSRDDDWRSIQQRAQEEEKRLAQLKAQRDRDAAFARQLSQCTSTPVEYGSSVPTGQTNAFDRILHRQPSSSQLSNQMTQPIRPEQTSNLPARPRLSQGIPSGTFGTQSNGTYGNGSYSQNSGSGITGSGWDWTSTSRGPGSQTPRTNSYPQNTVSTVKTEPRQFSGGPSWTVTPSRVAGIKHEANEHPSRMPGTWEDSDSGGDEAAAGYNSWQQGRPQPPSHPSHLSMRTLPPPTPSSYSRMGFGSLSRFAGPNTDRPGLLNNGNFFDLDYLGASTQPSLAATIHRTNQIDFQNMLDGNGNPLNPQLASYLDDFVHNPVKTEEEIQQLLSNIRPDMEIPQEERGETPPGMKYPLYPHQQLALKWMTDMETGINKGGILADDMGLGKTVSTLALMTSRPSETPGIRTNLIIGPVALIKQWENEVKNKLKGTHKMSVYLLHQKKKLPFSELRNYDVVLTTYGSISSEWRQYEKHVEQRNAAALYSERDDTELAKKCPVLHPNSMFYRIIIDEAQCIKNKDTQSSKGVHKINAIHRWCLTGTPMMNNVSELYPLIRFLRIKPFSDHRHFQQAFKCLGPRNNNNNDHLRSQAMSKLQVVLKAIMLRRMKSSEIDGKPILTLPPKTERSEFVEFSADEKQFYQDLETRSQVVFNKYLRAGTVSRNYSNILVLLLRLRQACCHPHLTDFECVNSPSDDEKMDDLAKKMDAAVIQRIKEIDAFECPICYDGVEDPVLVIPCGHDTCTECFTSLTDNSARNNLVAGNENASAKCPQCRGPVDSQKIIKYTTFRRIHMPETLSKEEVKEEELPEISDWTDSSEEELDSDNDSVGSLEDFIVNDEADELDEDAKVDAEIEAAAKASKKAKAREAKEAKKAARKAKKAAKKAASKSKGKSKVEPVNPGQLRTLRVEAGRNKEARRRYMHYLRDNWEDSAKVTQVIELLKTIQETNEKTIIFSQWTSLLDLIECQIKYNLKLRHCRYTGDMSRTRRDEAVQDFVENPENKVMLVSLRAGNAGLNLTVASRVIICDPFWNPFIEMQAVDRAHRIGQQKEVQVHRILIKETVEDRILSLQEQKRELVETALDAGESKKLGRLSERELAYLFGVGSRR